MLILHLFFGLLKSSSFSTFAFFVGCFMYSYHNLLPRTFNTTFVTNRQSTHNTRNANNYRPYFCRTNIKQFTILHLGSKLWNSLPHNLTELLETICPRICPKSRPRSAKIPLPVDLCRSKTSLLKLPIKTVALFTNALNLR